MCMEQHFIAAGGNEMENYSTGTGHRRTRTRCCQEIRMKL